MPVRLFVCFFLISFFPLAAHALRVKVAVDGAAVYARPDFDSEVIDYLNLNTSVAASHKLFTEKVGLGAFHKIKTPSNKYGFIADSDVIVPKGAKIEQPAGAKGAANNAAGKTPPNTRKHPPSKKHKSFEDEDPEIDPGIFFSKYIGGSIAFVDYTEKFQGQKLDSNIPFVGFRMTGAGALLGGPPIDFNIAISPTPPKYLSQFGSGSSSGFILLGDLLLMLPLVDEKTYLVNYGLGFMWTYSDYSVQVGKQGYSSQDFRVGIEFELGYAYRFNKKYLLRADLKYYIEQSMYLSEMVSFQVAY
jgi:hypothetical protein